MQSLEYILKYYLDSVTLKVKDVKDISDPQAIQYFHKKYSDHVKIIRGFTSQIDATTFFPIFNIPLSESTIHTVIYCDVAVGESIYVNMEYATTLNPPEHYSSYIVGEVNQTGGGHPTTTNTTTPTFPSLNIGNTSYAIRDPSRILPLFEVTFEYDEEVERKSKGMFLCEKCKINQSCSFCPSEKANFCQSCDEDIHDNEFTRRHERYYFNQVGKKKFIYCMSHGSVLAEYFCEECMLPVCIKCKMEGSHSLGGFQGHKLIPYIQACDKVQGRIREESSALKKKEEECEKKIEEFRGQISKFNERIEGVRAQIEREYKSVMNELLSFEKNQYQIINADLLRSLGDLHHLKRMREYPEGLEPSQLIRSYKHVVMQREGFKMGAYSYTPKEVVLSGRLTLGGEEVLAPRQGYTPRMDKSTKYFIETRGKRD